MVRWWPFFAALTASVFAPPLLVLALWHAPPQHKHWLIDPVAWGNRVPGPGGRWIVLGPAGDATSRVGFAALWDKIRVVDHQAFRAPFAQAGRVDPCRTTFETEGLRVISFVCRKGATLVSIVNRAAQPRVVFVGGR